MNEKVNAIVLTQNDYREADYLLKVLTKEYGLLTFVAKGAKKMNSKNAVCCMPFTEAIYVINYEDNKDIFSIHNSSLVRSNTKFSENLNISCMAQMMCEIIVKTIDNNSNYETDELFNLLLFCLEKIDNNNYYLVTCLYISNILKILGIDPVVDECVVCGDTKVIAISNVSGGFVCKNCSSDVSSTIYEPIFLRKFRLINKATTDNFDILAKLESYNETDLKILVDFLIEHSGISLLSWVFFTSFNVD